ncbi:potassium channel family protein [Halobellus limi]|jgi:trk system potassium uptake protein TrkA|uniref:Trk system potassium uptake protein TrkA n=1 Tax=Halobellus limi TaxID=699433 RepID=A0A1H5UUY7_9EURY|nr:TrkA family potassium uptake protein [Halobellus limi]QCC46928.1 TrkA family potassium uptake protein [Halobellus limi]SEF78238.1 trk system potassium uptake protein TrkA [Halobellus limi]
MTDTEHVVIAGSGRVGHRVAEHFADRGRSVTVIDPDPTGGFESDDVEVVRGDATKPSVLEDAITERTGVVGALTDKEDTNLVVCMAAKRYATGLRTVARIEDRAGDEYDEYVDEVYFPERASIRAAVNALTGSDVRTIEEVTGELEVLDVRIDYDAPAAGEVVADALPEGSVVIAESGGHVAVQHSTKLVEGRRYLIAADRDVVGDVIEQCRGERPS